MKKLSKSISEIRIEKIKEGMIECFSMVPIVQSVCEKFDVPRSTFYRWRKEDYWFSQQVDSAIKLGNETVYDLAHSRHIALIQEKKWPAIKYVLDKKEKKDNGNNGKLSLLDLAKRLADEEEEERNKLENSNK